MEQILDSVIEVETTDMANGGDSVARVNGQVIFVKGAIAGERVQARIIENRRDFVRAEVTAILTPSPNRIAVQYPDLTETGGLQWQHIRYAAQLDWKAAIVKQLLMRIGKLANPNVLPVLGIPEQQNYWQQRTIAQFSIGEDGAIGFRRMATHETLDMPTCPIAHPSLDITYQHVRRFLQRRFGEDLPAHIQRFTIRIAANPPGLPITQNKDSAQQSAYKMRTPAILIIEMNQSGEYTSDKDAEELGKAIISSIPSIVGVVCVGVTGLKRRIVVGQDYLQEKVNNKVFRISAGSFFQVNASQTPALAQKVVEFAQLRHGDIVLDGYSGGGLFSVFLAEQAAKVISIESSVSSIADAHVTAEINHISNIQIIEGLLEKNIQQAQKMYRTVDVVVIDPPRAGCHPRAMEGIKKLEPRTIVYVSCDPATLARDVRTLSAENYRLVVCQPIDMFPNTAHIESVALLQRD